MSMLRSELDARGITFSMRNEALLIGMGELQPTDICPELWITEDSRFSEAAEILRDLRSEGRTG